MVGGQQHPDRFTVEMMVKNYISYRRAVDVGQKLNSGAKEIYKCWINIRAFPLPDDGSRVTAYIKKNDQALCGSREHLERMKATLNELALLTGRRNDEIIFRDIHRWRGRCVPEQSWFVV